MKVKYAGVGLLLTAFMLLIFFKVVFDWPAKLILPCYDLAPEPDRILLISGKLQTLSWLFPVALLVFSFRREIRDKAGKFIRLEGLGLIALGLCVLSIPGTVFYFVGIQIFQITSYLLIVSGLLMTLLVEFFLLTSLLWAASRMSRFNRTIAIVLVSVYELLVLAMAALMSVSGETDYIKYTEMILEADYGYLVHPRMIFFSVLGLLSVSFAVLKLQVKYYGPTLLQRTTGLLRCSQVIPMPGWSLRVVTRTLS